MMRATRRRIGSPAWLGLALMLGLPAMAEAQLFPNRTVTRQRQPCASEPPFYSTVRQNYFGYYPTCWSRFPAGWQCPCPNPELPNPAAEFARQKRDELPTSPPDERDPNMLPGDDVGPAPADRPAGDAGMPPLPDPGGRAPFPKDDAPADNIPRRNLPGNNTNPVTPPTTMLSPAAGRPAPSLASSPASPPVTTTGLLEMPRITPPVASNAAVEANLNPSTLALAPDVTLASTNGIVRPNLGPLPAAPLPDASTPVGGAMGVDPSLLSSNSASSTAAPAQAPQRKGILGGLFNSSKRRR